MRHILPALTLLVLATVASAADPVVLPETGVDTPGYVQALVEKLGTVLGYAIGAGFAFFAVWTGVKYIKAAMGRPG